MKQYALVTWKDEKLVRYEMITKDTEIEAIAFSEGLITERANASHEAYPLPGTTFVIEEGHRNIVETPHYLGDVIIGAWHITGEASDPVVTWQRKVRDLEWGG